MRASTDNPHVECDEVSTEDIIARFYRHADAVRTNAIDTKLVMWHIYAAKGYHKLLAERALEGDDEAGNVALGAPHWVTYNDGTLQSILNLIQE